MLYAVRDMFKYLVLVVGSPIHITQVLVPFFIWIIYIRLLHSKRSKKVLSGKHGAKLFTNLLFTNIHGYQEKRKKKKKNHREQEIKISRITARHFTVGFIFLLTNWLHISWFFSTGVTKLAFSFFFLSYDIFFFFPPGGDSRYFYLLFMAFFFFFSFFFFFPGNRECW